MSLKDLNDEPEQAGDYDLIIIGAGPAGLVIASEFLGSGLRVAVLESGGETRDAATDALNDFEDAGHPRAPHTETRCRGLGGTSAIWTGRCGMLDEIDFHPRPWLHLSGWPVGPGALRPFYHRAGPYLGLNATLSGAEAGHDLHQPFDDPPWNSAVFRDAAWQFSNADNDGAALLRQLADARVIEAGGTGVLQHSGRTTAVNMGERLRKPLADSADIDVFLNATASEIETGADAARTVLVARPDGSTVRFHGRRVVLACGGIENARLLLASRSSDPRGLGNAHDQVGRYLTDHHFSEIGRFVDGGGTEIRRRFGSRWRAGADAKTVYCMGVRLAEGLQRDQSLLNATIHIVDFGSRLNALSILAGGARAAKQKDLGTASRKAAQALRHPGDLAVSARDRFVRGTPPLNRPELTLLGCVMEQELDPDSRVTLSDRKNRLGQPMARIDWRIAEREYRTARAVADLFYAETDRLGLAPAQRPDWLQGGFDDWARQLTDLAHPSCTTRMSDDPATGVVDANCKLHGVDGVYVAGSSVFPTPGHMNPTQTIVALAIRLADHLKTQAVAGSGLPARAATARRLRIGFVGGGHRVATIYHPVTRALADRVEVVGVVTASAEGAARIAAQTGWAAQTDLGRLAHEGRPDFLVAALPPGANDDLYPGLVALGVPLLLETPFCWSELRGRKLLKQIRKSGRLVGVAEQFPFLPEYQLWQKLIGLGLIGRVDAVVNDFAVYDYHGTGLLRTLMGRERRPDHATATLAPMTAPHEQWSLGSVRFTDGSFLINNYSASYAANPIRPTGEVRVIGTQGSLRNGQALFATDADPLIAPIQRHEAVGDLTALSVQTPDGEVRWDNPFAGHGLSDEQIAVAELLTRMGEAALHGAPPPYAPSAGLEDVELLAALRYSAARGGARIPFPLQATAEKLRGKARQVGGKVAGRLRRRG